MRAAFCTDTYLGRGLARWCRHHLRSTNQLEGLRERDCIMTSQRDANVVVLPLENKRKGCCVQEEQRQVPYKNHPIKMDAFSSVLGRS